MWICGQHFSPGTIERIQLTVDADPSISRRALSRQVCEWLDWQTSNGKLKDMSCRKALVELERRGLVQLPEVKATYGFQQNRIDALPEIAEVSCDLEQLGRVEVVPVLSRRSKASRIWKALMAEYHYLGSGPLCGAQTRYLIHSEAYGWLGGLSFNSATWRLKIRDEWIGWNERACRTNLAQVICNSRFLILPTVVVPNLASHVLSLSLNRVVDDWFERYGYKPVLVETFVDPQRFRGSCYRAANWVLIGQTVSRSTPYTNGKVASGKKDIYAYPLRENWREVLCRQPDNVLGIMPRPEDPTDWAEEEFGSVEIYDERLKARLLRLARDFFAQPGVLVPQVCNGSKASTKAAYRFFNNRQVDMKTLLKPHIESSIERIKNHDVVLAVQDTTSLNYTAHPAEGLGPINTTKDNAVGLIVHDTMAFTTEGTPLGLLDVQCWARDPEQAGKSEQRRDLPIEDKESIKWLKSYRAVCQAQELCPESTLISVGDRESDIYELFHEAAQNPSGPKLLVRAERSRNRKVEEVPLWDELSSQPITGFQEVYIPAKGSRPSRTAKLAVRFAQVKLRPPRDKKLEPVVLWAIYAHEEDKPEFVQSPLSWMLLTSVETNTFEQACERLAWYAKRWGIEVYHRTLKSGCRIEDRRLDNADRLEACLAIDMVVAWRVYWLTKQGRETPDIGCDVFLSEDEWKALYAFVKKEQPPSRPPSLREAVRMIASLGGFLGRKCDGEPGTTTMWRGLQRLADIVKAFVLARLLEQQRAGPP
jgi:hypothetical protein